MDSMRNSCISRLCDLVSTPPSSLCAAHSSSPRPLIPNNNGVHCPTYQNRRPTLPCGNLCLARVGASSLSMLQPHSWPAAGRRTSNRSTSLPRMPQQQRNPTRSHAALRSTHVCNPWPARQSYSSTFPAIQLR
eukprot:scaffold21879_cov15-Tisochrysis_lutea.AAC.1